MGDQGQRRLVARQRGLRSQVVGLSLVVALATAACGDSVSISGAPGDDWTPADIGTCDSSSTTSDEGGHFAPPTLWVTGNTRWESSLVAEFDFRVAEASAAVAREGSVELDESGREVRYVVSGTDRGLVAFRSTFVEGRVALDNLAEDGTLWLGISKTNEQLYGLVYLDGDEVRIVSTCSAETAARFSSFAASMDMTPAAAFQVLAADPDGALARELREAAGEVVDPAEPTPTRREAWQSTPPQRRVLLEEDGAPVSVLRDQVLVTLVVEGAGEAAGQICLLTEQGWVSPCLDQGLAAENGFIYRPGFSVLGSSTLRAASGADAADLVSGSFGAARSVTIPAGATAETTVVWLRLDRNGEPRELEVMPADTAIRRGQRLGLVDESGAVITNSEASRGGGGQGATATDDG